MAARPCPDNAPNPHRSRALWRDCIDILGLREDRLNAEFTRHAGDEMYHPTLRGYSPEWSDNEAQ